MSGHSFASASSAASSVSDLASGGGYDSESEQGVTDSELGIAAGFDDVTVGRRTLAVREADLYTGLLEGPLKERSEPWQSRMNEFSQFHKLDVEALKGDLEEKFKRQGLSGQALEREVAQGIKAYESKAEGATINYERNLRKQAVKNADEAAARYKELSGGRKLPLSEKARLARNGRWVDFARQGQASARSRAGER